MPVLSKLTRQVLYLNHHPDLKEFVDCLPDSVTVNGNNISINKAFAKDILIAMVAHGPLTPPQLAGLLGVNVSGPNFFYTFDELKKKGIARVYSEAGSTKWYSVSGFVDEYIKLSVEDLRENVFTAKSERKELKEVTDLDIRRPPAPPAGTDEILPMDV